MSTANGRQKLPTSWMPASGVPKVMGTQSMSSWHCALNRHDSQPPVSPTGKSVHRFWSVSQTKRPPPSRGQWRFRVHSTQTCWSLQMEAPGTPWQSSLDWHPAHSKASVHRAAVGEVHWSEVRHGTQVKVSTLQKGAEASEQWKSRLQGRQEEVETSHGGGRVPPSGRRPELAPASEQPDTPSRSTASSATRR